MINTLEWIGIIVGGVFCLLLTAVVISYILIVNSVNKALYTQHKDTILRKEREELNKK